MNTLLTLLLAVGVAACEHPQQKSDSAGGDVAATSDASLDLALQADPVLRAAQRAIDQGHPWRATKLLAPVVRDPKRRTPTALLLAARAASRWEGWGEVDRLLASERWLDTRFGGEGRELLARAALERDADTLAVRHAAAAVRSAGDDRARGVRLTLLARALDRVNARDSAAATYARAARLLPPAREWLLLRAAGVTADSAARGRMYAEVRRPVARARVPWTEAQALERSGQMEAAAQRYAALGAVPSALRLRFSIPSDSAGRARLEDSVLAFVRARSGTAAARQAIEVLDKYLGYPLSPASELVVARSAAESGPVSRAITAYERAGGLLGQRDRLLYGQLLVRADRHREAAAQLARVDSAPIAGDAAYHRARALLLGGDGAAARTALREVANRYAQDADAASAALFLLADLRTDDGDDAEARTIFKRLYARYPNVPRADDARFRAAIIAFAAGDARAAALEMDSLVAAHGAAGESNAARYWAGRAWAAAGDSATARARWRDMIAKDPLSYYSGLSARRLGDPGWRPGPRRAAPRSAAIDSVMNRVALLDRLGMDAEIRFEYDALDDGATTPGALLAAAQALLGRGEASRAIRLALRAIDQGDRTLSAYRLAYPLVDRDELVRASRARSLDPAFVAGLIRQESSFNPRAVSPAGARGLMQVMPSVGAGIARSLDFPVWDARLLFDPDANIEIGTAHLRSALREYDDPIRALAAYNAGGSRVSRWAQKAGTRDPELFAERIPFTETRDYVRIVSRNAEIYRVLYDW